MGSGYREYRPPPAVAATVACLWEQEPAVDHRQRVIPDGCVDLMWLAGRDLVVAGADTGPRGETLPAHTLTSGIRFRPGAAGAVLGVPASELRDRQLEASELWGSRVVELTGALAAATPGRRLRLLTEAVLRSGGEPDPLVQAAAKRLTDPGARVSSVAADLGVSERHLHRRTLFAVGYGPKMLARVARLRRLVSLAGEPLAIRAVDAGYASQAHMSEEVRRLTGTTPVRFLKDAALTSA